MTVRALFILLCLSLTSYAVTSAYDEPKVKAAIDLQKTLIDDPLFAQILTELEASGSIDWSGGRADRVKEKLSDYKSNTDWLLSKYKSAGGFDKSSVFLWKKLNPWSSTTASTSTCGNSTKLNTRKLDRDEYSILNTLIHERVHSFCVNHYKDQTRQTNQCDAAYIAGDLAEIIMAYRKGQTHRVMDVPICPALLQKIQEYKLMNIN